MGNVTATKNKLNGPEQTTLSVCVCMGVEREREEEQFGEYQYVFPFSKTHSHTQTALQQLERIKTALFTFSIRDCI